MKRYLLIIAAIAIVACAPKKKDEIPSTLINTNWFYFADIGKQGTNRLSKELKLAFYFDHFKMTSRSIVTEPNGDQDITYDTLLGKNYSYTKPNGTMVFERETFNPCSFVAGVNTLTLSFINEKMEFVKN